MRVLLLGPIPPPHGGVQTNLIAIRDHLLRSGHWCGAVNLTRYRGVDGNGLYYPRTAPELVKLLATLPYDILHVHLGGNLTNRLIALCLVCCAIPGKRTVLTFHSGGYPSSPDGKATTRHSLRAFALRRFDALIAVNDEIHAWFAKCGARNIYTIEPHAIGSAFAEELRPDLRAFYDTHSPILLSVGGLEPEYDLPLQIHAMEHILKQHPNAGLVMIGGGSQRSEIEALIRAKAYAASLLLAGDVAHAVTLRAIAECDIFLRTTHYDGDSISVREALHIGVPVIATDNGMRPPGCHLIPARDVDALVRAVNDIPRTRERKGGSGAENLDKVMEVYAQFQ